MFVQTDMDLSKQETQLGLKQAFVCLLKASIRSLTGWNGCLNEGSGDVVSFRCFRIASKRLLDMYACRHNGTPQNMSGMSFDQNIRLGTPCVVAKSKRIVLNRRNSPHVRGSERVLFVAWRMVTSYFHTEKAFGTQEEILSLG